jgi:hypothetical protein
MNVTVEHIEAVYDAVNMMRLFSQRLADGEVHDIEASEMSWLLGSAKKRLDPVIGILELAKHEQERSSPDPQDDLLEIGAQILAVMERFKRRREAGEAA